MSLSIATVVEEQLHVPSYRNASVHTCTCTTVSERKSPWHFVGSLINQTDETTSWGTDMHVGVGRGYTYGEGSGFSGVLLHLDKAV